MPQITRKVLVQQLRDLERDGTVHPGVPARVDYALTGYGRTLEPVIDAICRLGEAHRLREAARGPDSVRRD
jgi:DNA-binding HxlR family transcriptional regulator